MFKRITKQQGSQTVETIAAQNIRFKRITKQQGSQTGRRLEEFGEGLRELQNNKALKLYVH